MYVFVSEKLISHWTPYASPYFPATLQLVKAMWLIHILLPDQSTQKLAQDPPALLPRHMFQMTEL